jgi:hypothetical protein
MLRPAQIELVASWLSVDENSRWLRVPADRCTPMLVKMMAQTEDNDLLASELGDA